MSKRLLSKLDHKKTEKEDMRYLIQPRGPGKSWVFRMVTQPDLVGVPNPWDGKPLGKEIKKGLGRVFPEWPIRPASGKAAAVSQWFTRFRRKVLGKETDTRLALHSTRHTWRTVARRAGVAEATINDLGGWAGPRSSNSIYDHGLLERELEAAQKVIWDRLEFDGYLEGF